MYRTLLFDMDGTLVDSAAGARHALNRALATVGRPPVSEARIRSFMGPPLARSLARLGLAGAELEQVWQRYAVCYRAEGLARTVPVAGMPELVARLAGQGFRLAIATCKPWEYCGPTLELCGFPPCFEVVAGSFHDGVGEDKSGVIAAALARLAPAEAPLMIGDRADDVLGAQSQGIPCLGVDFCGYAVPGELAAAGALAVVNSPAQLEAYLTAPNGGEL